MNTGLPITHRNALAITPNGTIVIFTEETRSQLYTLALRKAASAQGIDAMASRAIDTGDFDNLDMIQAAASDLADAMKGFADIIGQMQITPAA